jgi:hypothetical protein
MKAKDVCLVTTLHDSVGWSLEPLCRISDSLDCIYNGKIVVATEKTQPKVLKTLTNLGWASVKPFSHVGISFISDSRRRALRAALENGFDHVHLVDMDRVLHWASTYPGELKTAVHRVPDAPFVIFGRTRRAMDTHPKNQIETEALANRVFNLILGVDMDITAASRGISREAGEVILKYSKGRFFDSDSEWPIILHCNNFHLDYMETEGLEWETRLKIRSMVVGNKLVDVKEFYELNPESWVYRLMLAHRISRTAHKTYLYFCKG